MKKLLLAMAFTLGFTGVAHANIMLEPYLGYEMGKTSDVSSINGKTDAVNLGLRLAYKTPVMLWLGLDGQFGTSGDYKPDSGSNASLKHNTYYGVVGLDLPILLRGWVGYGFSDELKLDSPYSGSLKGTNFKIGVGFTGLPFVSLNAEYIKGNLTKVSEGPSDGTSLSATDESVMLSVSLPLVF